MSSFSLEQPISASPCTDKNFPVKSLFFVEEREFSKKDNRYSIYIRPCARGLVDRSRFREILREQELVVKSITIQAKQTFETYELHEKWVTTPSDQTRFFEEVNKKGGYAIERDGVYYREVFPKIGRFNKHNYKSIQSTYSPCESDFPNNNICCNIL